MDGLQLSKSVRQRFPEIKVLVMTGHSLEEGRLQTLQQTAVPWIQKPFSLQEPVSYTHLTLPTSDLV